MPLEPIYSETLKSETIRHGFFTRRGGVSEGLYKSLNAGYGSNDLRQNISQNRALIAHALGAETAPVLTPYQVHSPVAAVVDEAWDPASRTLEGLPKADALVTTTPGLIIGVLTADCTPILFADKDNGIIAAAHAGWRGAMSGIIEATVEKMILLGSKKEKIQAVIGPTIGLENYEVGDEFKSHFLAHAVENEMFFATHQQTGRAHFNLPAYCADRIEKAGLPSPENVNLCTYQNESLFFSYRRNCHKNQQDYGRQLTAIVKT